MEQYEIDSSVYYENIRKALDSFIPKRIFIRWAGSMEGKTVVREDLKGKTLDIAETNNGLSIVIDGKEVFLYEFKKTDVPDEVWGTHFSIAYFRGWKVCLPTGINPDDPILPPVQESILRGANYTHLIEVTFEGKIPLRVHSPKNKDRWWDLWEINA